MRVAVSADERLDLIRHLTSSLQRRGHEITMFGASTTTTAAANDVHRAAARAVVEGTVDSAVVCSWSGAGAAIYASGVAGARAAHCTDAETARVARQWAHANVLALSLRLTSQIQMEEILDAWFSTTSRASGAEGLSLEQATKDRLGRISGGVLDRIVGDLDQSPWLREIVLTPLSQHDEVRGTSLQDTLVLFCRSGFSLRQAAHTLRVHPNTVGYRMRSIKEVTGLDYREIDDLILLALAARTIGGPEWQTRVPWSR